VLVHVAVGGDTEDTMTAVQPVMIVPFDLKDTVPVGFGGPTGEIVAVKVTTSPELEGFSLETNVVAVGPTCTTCDKVGLMLPAFVLLPE
jgi:hypothetical protein